MNSLIGKVVDALEMPVLSAVLGNRAAKLEEIAVRTIVRVAATRSLSQVMAATGQKIAGMGAQEMEEGAIRLVAVAVAEERSNELAAASAALLVRGVVTAEVAGAAADVARGAARVGVSQVEQGAAKIGASVVMDDVAESMEDVAEDGRLTVVPLK